MAKRLITQDYKEIVFESLKIPESDFHNYYLVSLVFIFDNVFIKDYFDYTPS